MAERLFQHLIRYLEPITSHYPAGGRLTKPIRVVLFDLYGTLFISGSGDIGQLNPNGPSIAGLDDVCRQYGIAAPAGQISQQLIRSIRAAHEQKKGVGIVYPEIEIDVIWQRILKWPDRNRVRDFAVVYEWTVNPTYPMPGLDETLRILQRRGLKMGIISNAQFFSPLLFDVFLGARSADIGFDHDLTLYSYQYGEAKPSRTLFDNCANQLGNMGFSPKSVLYVGNDMRNDIVPAAKTGWQTALFAGDHRSLRLRQNHEACQNVRPDLVVTDLRQLIDWI